MEHDGSQALASPETHHRQASLMDIKQTLIDQRNTARSEQERLLSGLHPNDSLTRTQQARFDQLSAEKRALTERLDRLDEDEDTAQRAGTALSEYGGVRYKGAEERALNEKFRQLIKTRSLEPVDISMQTSQMRSGFQPGIEKRSIITTSGTGLVGVSFYDQILLQLVDSSAILTAGATVIQSNSGEPLNVPKSTALSVAGLIPEGTIIPEADPGLGFVTFRGWKYGGLIQVSTELATDSTFDLTGFLAKQAGVALGNGFGANAVNGTGTLQPRGILTDATMGVTGPTGTATSLGTQGTTGQGGDLLLNLVASIAEPYARAESSAWLMRNATLTIVRSLKDTMGRYIFDTNVIPGSGSAGTLLGRPVYIDPNMPAMAANAKSILFGDISRYWVRQVNGVRFEASTDFAFSSDITTYRFLARLDGALVDTTGAVKYFQNSAT